MGNNIDICRALEVIDGIETTVDAEKEALFANVRSADDEDMLPLLVSAGLLSAFILRLEDTIACARGGLPDVSDA